MQYIDKVLEEFRRVFPNTSLHYLEESMSMGGTRQIPYFKIRSLEGLEFNTRINTINIAEDYGMSAQLCAVSLLNEAVHYLIIKGNKDEK